MFYLTIANAVYFGTYNLTEHIVLHRASANGEDINYTIMIPIILVQFVVVPVNYNPFRNQLFYIMNYKHEFFKKQN